MKELPASSRQIPAGEMEPGEVINDDRANVSSSVEDSEARPLAYPDIATIGLWNFDFTLPTSLHKLSPLDLKGNSGDFIFIEVFAGSGNLSESVRNAGLSVHAIDSVSKRQSGVAIHTLDLTKSNDASILLDIACNGMVASAHFAPPCGTSSKARERPLPPEMAHMKAEPLRSEQEPLGKSGIHELDSIRVAAANKLYALTVLVATILLIRGASISIENPSGSYFWMVIDIFIQQHPWLQAIWSALVFTEFQSCMYGGTRDKWTKLLSSKGLYDDINKTCDGSHTHESWRPTLNKGNAVFPTASETAYPRGLCDAMAASLIRFLAQQDMIFPAENLQHDTHITARHLRQHGKKPLPPLLAEYWIIADLDIAKNFQHYKPIKYVPKRENGGVVQGANDIGQLCKELEKDHATSRGTIVRAVKSFSEVEQWYGVWRTPEQALVAVESIQHPLDMHVPIPDLLLKAVANVLESGHYKVVANRASQCKRLLKRLQELEADEANLHSSLDPQVGAVLKGKNILLWKELLIETEFPDLDIVDEVLGGIKLVGTASTSKAFPSGITVAQQSVEQLQKQAVWRRRASVGKCQSSGDQHADKELWRQSLQEVEDGWLGGPYYTEEEVSKLLKTSDWICTRRFPLKQTSKIRLIDDGLESGLNSAYSCYNKLQLMDMDAVVALSNAILQSFCDDGHFDFRLSDGSCLSGKIHKSWGQSAKLLGRTLDLTAAYKQLAVSPDQNFVRSLVAFDPVLKQPAYFIFNALPFGATSSVYSFNRVAKSLWHIMVSLGGVWATQYYDDYPNVELAQLADNSRNFMEFILQVLGWRFASSGKKAEPPCEKFRVLGVELNFAGAGDGSFVVANKEERISDLVQLLGTIVQREKLTGSEASSLHGQLNFAQGQYYGCSLKPAMVFLQKVMRLGWQSHFREELILMSTYLVTALRTCPPRTISTSDCKVPVMIFTDGAYEPERAGLVGSSGMVIFDPATGFKMVQAVEVSQQLLDHWKRHGSKQPIAYLELWPVAVCLFHYGASMSGRRVIFYIDNNAVRDALIKGVSPNVDMFCMLAFNSLQISIHSLSVWYTRISSASNPGDAPSRDQAEEMARRLGASLCEPLPVPGELADALLSRRSFVEFMKKA